jgi:hypothetical protein
MVVGDSGHSLGDFSSGALQRGTDFSFAFDDRVQGNLAGSTRGELSQVFHDDIDRVFVLAIASLRNIELVHWFYNAWQQIWLEVWAGE